MTKRSLRLRALDFGPADTGEATDPVVEQNRLSITDQTRAILVLAAGTLR